MGKPTEALASFDPVFAIRREIAEAELSTSSHWSDLAVLACHRSVAMRKCGRLADSVRDFRQAIEGREGVPSPDLWDDYNRAFPHSLSSGIASEAMPGLTDEEARAAAEAALTALRRAVAVG